MTDQNTKLPSNQQAKWPDPPWSIPPYVVDTVHSISTLSIPAPATPGPFDWVLSSNGVKADIDFNFNTNQVLLNGSVSKAAILQTTTRASTAWADDINGNWSSFGSGIPRVTSKGYLYEGEARTNSIRCSDMTGAVVADGIERTTNGNLALAVPASSGGSTTSQNTVQNGWQYNLAGGTGTIVYSAGLITMVGDGTHAEAFGSGGLTTVVGLTYTITVDVGGGGCSVQAGTTALSANNLNVSATIGSATKYQFVATSTTTFISFAHAAATSTTLANISVLSAGKLPNNWVLSTSGGLALQIAGVGSESGLNCIDLRLFGTSSGSAFAFNLESVNQIVAAYGQTWTGSIFSKKIAGSLTNILSIGLTVAERNSGGSSLNVVGTPLNLGSAALGTQRVQVSYTLPDAAAAFVGLRIDAAITTSAAIDVTVRVALPQEELNPSLDSSVASAVVHSGGGGSGYANGDTGTISGGTANTAATYTVTGQSAGVVTSVSVTAGDYTVFPPNSGTGVATASGGAQPGSGTGLLLDLTPVNQVSFGYGVASSPIPTTSAAVTRAADTNSPFSIVTGSGVTLYTKAIPLGTYTPSLQTACQMDDGSGSNRIIIDYIQGLQQTSVISAGSNVYSQLGSGWSAGVSSWIAVSSTAGAQLLSIDGVTKTSGTGAQPIGMNSLRIGSYLSNLLPFMGYIQRVSVFSNTALSQLVLNGLQ